VSRSGYSDDCDGWALIRWRGAVKSATSGKRGQKLLTDIAAAMDAMPVKRLVADSLTTPTGEFCTLGVVGHAQGIDIAALDPEDSDAVAKAFGIAPALAKEIVFKNDEGGWPNETPEMRWTRMREWTRRRIKEKTEQI
jgi:hypothetical protein